METAAVTSWTLIQEIPIPDDVNELPIDGEDAVAAYRTFRDSAVFTTKRLIVRDAQGLTGKLLDFNAELEMWTRAGHIKIKLDKKIDIRRLDNLIAWAVLQS